MRAFIILLLGMLVATAVGSIGLRYAARLENPPMKSYLLVWGDFSTNNVKADEIRTGDGCSTLVTSGNVTMRICMPHMLVLQLDNPEASSPTPNPTPSPTPSPTPTAAPGAAPVSSIAENRSAT